jgi:hypothetical protein
MVKLFRDKVGSEGNSGELSEVSASGGCQLPGGSTYALKKRILTNPRVKAYVRYVLE